VNQYNVQWPYVLSSRPVVDTASPTESHKDMAVVDNNIGVRSVVFFVSVGRAGYLFDVASDPVMLRTEVGSREF
jgi:hypothetical protein